MTARFIIRIALIPSFLLLVPFLAGTLRTVSGCSLTLALALGAASALFLFVFSFALAGQNSEEHLPALPVVLFSSAGFLLFLRLFYHPYLYGMVSVGGGDAGNHVQFLHEFVSRSPHAYNSFVNFYSCVQTLKWLLGLDDFEAFRLIFYSEALILIVIIFSALVSAAEEKNTWRSQFTLLLLFSVLLAYPALHVIFPIMHYLQADGFYPQLFGLIPLFGMWLVYGVVTAPTVRIAAFFLLIVISRYTYGLNLGDLVMTAAAILALEAFCSFKRPFSNWLFLSVFPLIFAALYIYKSLFIIYPMQGATVPVSVEMVLMGTALLLASLLFALQSGTPTAIFTRLIFFSFSFSLSALLPQLLALALGLQKTYYLYKYNIYSSVLLSVTALTAASVLVQHQFGSTPLTFFDVSRFVFRKFGLLLPMGVGLFLLGNAYEPYYVTFKERIRRERTLVNIQPLVDRGAWEFINQVLASRQKSFGGFIPTPSWPLSRFMNSSFGFYLPVAPHNQALAFYPGLKLRFQDGRCVFWNSAESDIRALNSLTDNEASPLFDSLSSKFEKEIGTYLVPWSDTPKKITAVCIDHKKRRKKKGEVSQ